MKIRILACGMLLCLVMASIAINAYADTIKLKNGTVIKGKVINFSAGSFTVMLDLGVSNQSRAIIDIRDIDNIEFDGRSDDASAKPYESSEPTTPRPSVSDDDNGHRSSNSSTDRSSTEPPTHTSPSPVKESAVVVSAKDDWTYTNLYVRRGDRIQVSATGKVKISATRDSGPEGVDLEDKDKLVANRPTGALIAVIGDDNDDFIFIGREGEFVAQRDGKLFLSVNEGDLTDNSGAFSTRVQIESEKTGKAATQPVSRPITDNQPTNVSTGKPPIEPTANRTSANSKESVAVVPAKDDWTYTNLYVRRGDRIQVSATGKVKISATRDSGPEGVDLEDKDKLVANRPTGALIAVIGDDNDDFIFIGREGEFVAQRDGKLFLSVNEGNLTDNSGAFNVKVRIEPER
ncbi:MAG: LecA/PA-IL family lectin [Acidobacteriota bacterium]